MFIKKHNNKNQYLFTESKLWVRDFTLSANPEDINNLWDKEYKLILNNEMRNATFSLPAIDAEVFYYPNVIIVSDGYQFEKKQHLLDNVNAVIIGVNRSLSKWQGKKMDWYLTNNPYSSCMSYLPKNNYYPRCIVSNRTNPEFIMRYKSRLGIISRYTPVTDKVFNSNYFLKPSYYIDDYRNPICAAISLAYRWQVKKLLLFCCDDVFENERQGSIKEGDKWMYPQHKIAKELIDGNLYWLKSQPYSDVKIGNYSSIDYENAENLKEIKSFF